jgi:hypothetical protein
MPQFMNSSTSNQQETYDRLVFNENEAIDVTYHRLYSEFERKVLASLSSTDTTLLMRAQDLLCLIKTFSMIDPVNEFFSKKCLKQYNNHEFLTEGGYPNDVFRIELLARAIKMIDYPNDTENRNQLERMHRILPEGSSKNLPRCLYVAGLALMGVAITGLLGSIPFAIAVTMFVVGILASLILLQAADILAQEQKNYQRYKLEISYFSNRLKNVQPPKSDQVDSTDTISQVMF